MDPRQRQVSFSVLEVDAHSLTPWEFPWGGSSHESRSCVIGVGSSSTMAEVETEILRGAY